MGAFDSIFNEMQADKAEKQRASDEEKAKVSEGLLGLVREIYPRYEPPKVAFTEELGGRITRGMMTATQAVMRLPEHFARALGPLMEQEEQAAVERLVTRGMDREEAESRFMLVGKSAEEGRGERKGKYLSFIDEHKRGVEAITANHPEWDATGPPKNVLDLITSPRKLSLAIAESLPLMVAAGITAVAGAPNLAAAMMYAVEGQEFYDQAIRDGASPEDAEKGYHLYGSVAMIIEYLQLQGILKIGKISRSALLTKTVAKVGSRSVTRKIVMEAAKEGIEEVTQGAWQEITAKLIYGKPILGDEGIVKWVDRRAQEFVTGAAMALIGIPGGAAMASQANLRETDATEAEKYPHQLPIADQAEFKKFALTPQGAMSIAAMNPQIAAEIAQEDAPSRNALRKLGIKGWGAKDRAAFSGLLKEALADQEGMLNAERENERAREQVVDMMSKPLTEVKELAEEFNELAITELDRRRNLPGGESPLAVLKLAEEEVARKKDNINPLTGKEIVPLDEQGVAAEPVKKVEEKPEINPLTGKPVEPLTEKEAEELKEPEKEIEREEEIITEPDTGDEVDRGEAGEPVPTGKLDPTNPEEALKIIEEHTNFVSNRREERSAVGGIFRTNKAGVITEREYTAGQIDTAYRTVQKPVPSEMADVELFAMPGKEAELKAIAAKMKKMGKLKAKSRGVRVLRPSTLPKAKTKVEDHIKAVFMAAARESTRYALNAVWVEGENIVATDGRRMFWAKGKWGKDGLYTSQAARTKGVLGKADKKGTFPKWQDIILDVDSRDAIQVNDLDKLYRHVQQAALLTSEESQGLMVLVNKDGSLGFSSSSPEVGHTEINVYPGAKILGGVNPHFLIDTIRFHAIRGNDGFELYFPSPERPMMTKSFDGKTNTIIMPINIDVTRVVEDAVEEPVPKSKGVKQKPEVEADEIHRGEATPVLEGDEESKGRVAAYAVQPPETTQGGKLLKSLQRDSKRKGTKKVGLRTIVDYTNDLVSALMLVGKTQVTSRSPAQYQSGPHIIRTRSGVWQLNFHEAGHALSGVIQDFKPDWFTTISEALLELTGPGTMASKKTPEEGMAELVRLYIINPGKIPDGLKNAFEKILTDLRPDLLAGFRDAHRAYAYHRSRPMADQLQSLQHDTPQKAGTAEQVSDILWSIMQNLIGDSMITHRLNRRIFNEIAGQSRLGFLDIAGAIGAIKSKVSKAYRAKLKLARGFRQKIKDTEADFETARQSILRIPQEVDAAIGGTKGESDGIRVLATGDSARFGDFTENEIKLLRDAGFDIPEGGTKHGEYIQIHNKSLSTIKHEVGLKNWEDFTTYGQYRAAFERYTRKGQQYPGMFDGLGPSQLKEYLAEQENAHPEWKEHFRSVNEYMDQLLLLPLLSGENSVAETIRIKTAWTDYWPLPRQVEGRPKGVGGEIGSGIKSAHGSSLAFRSLDEAVKMRTRMAFEAYYMNRFMTSLVELGRKAGTEKGISFEARKMVSRIMLPLRLETKKVAKLKESEEQQVIADYLDEQLAQNLGMSLKELKSNGLNHKPEDIQVARSHVDLWRQKKPNAINVVSLFVQGERQYYQVTDPQIFKMFSRGMDPGAFMRHVKNILKPTTAPWKRALTQNWGFVIWNVVRDTGTAQVMQDHRESYLRGFYLASGVLNRLLGKHKETIVRSELLSKTLDQLTQDTHRTIFQNFLGMLAEGVAIRGWGDMSWLERLEEVPGQLMSAGLKPIDLANWVLGSRAVSQLSEEVPREGAFVEARKRGESHERAQLEYEKSSGNFGQRGSSPVMASIIEIAGFLNPGLQIQGGLYEKASDPDPEMRAKLFMVKLPVIAATSAAGAALGILLIKMMNPDEDDQEEIFNQMRERPDKDRMGYRSIFGVIKVPFDYGILGAVDSWAWNAAEEYLLEDTIPTDTKISTLVARARDIPGIADFVQPHFKTVMELKLNHSFFFDDAIVPEWMVQRYGDQPERQVWPTTPAVYKKIGKALNVSPIKVQYAVRNIFTRQMHDIVRATDVRPYEVASEWPVIGRLVTRPAEGFGSQSVQTVAEMDSQWSIVRSRIRNMIETGGADPRNVQKLRDKEAELTLGHQVMHEVDDLWSAAKAERKKEVPDIAKIRSLKSQMTEKARKFTQWDEAGRKGKFPEGIISASYRRKLVKQRKQRPSKRKKGESQAEFQARRAKVMAQKRQAAYLLSLL